MPASEADALREGYTKEQVSEYMAGLNKSGAATTPPTRKPQRRSSSSSVYFTNVVDPIIRPLVKDLKRDKPSKVMLVACCHECE